VAGSAELMIGYPKFHFLSHMHVHTDDDSRLDRIGLKSNEDGIPSGRREGYRPTTC
jgi:hypothetical protein